MSERTYGVHRSPIEVYFSLPPMPEREAKQLIRAISRAHADAALTHHPASRGLVEVRVQRRDGVARLFLSASALRIITQYELCSGLDEQHAEWELPTDAALMLKYEPSFTTPPDALRAIEDARSRST